MESLGLLLYIGEIVNTVNFDLLDYLLAVASLGAMLYFNNRNVKRNMANDKKQAEKDNDLKIGQKADKSYVDKLDKASHLRMNDMRDDIKDLVKKVDMNQSKIMDSLQNLNNNIINMGK